MANYPEWFDKLLRSDDFISSDKYFFNSRAGGYIYKKRDYLYKFGRAWRGKIQFPVILDKLISNKRILVVGHSDIPVTFQDLEKLKLLNFKKIYGTNTFNLEDFSYSIPIGLTNNSRESQAHIILGNTGHFRSAHEHSNLNYEFNGSIYVNFNIQNNSKIRTEALNSIKNLRGVVYAEPVLSNQGRIQFLKGLREHSMVLTPEGNGIDTHRLWETLYMGGTPIIKRSNYLPTILSELAVIIVDDWKELQDEQKIEQRWVIAQSKRSQLKYLEASYWLNIIKEY